MARSSKGQSVKRFKDDVPQPNLTEAEVMTHVYFKSDEGRFYIYLPDHIAAVVRVGVPGLGQDYRGTQDDPEVCWVRADIQQEVMDAWGEVKDQYRAITRAQGAVKVIVYRVLGKVPSRPSHFMSSADKRFAFYYPDQLGPGTALLLNYEVLWRSGNRLYYGHYSGEDLILQDKGGLPGPDGKDLLIDWTEEREAFFKAMERGLTELIDKLTAFASGDVAGAIDRVRESYAVKAAGGVNPLMLLADEVEESDEDRGKRPDPLAWQVWAWPKEHEQFCFVQNVGGATSGAALVKELRDKDPTTAFAIVEPHTQVRQEDFT